MCVPLTFRDRIYGAITFVGEGNRHYDERDLALATELGRRTGIADSQLLEGLLRIAWTADRMAEMINEILDLSRIQTVMPLALELRLVNFTELAARVVTETLAGTDRNPHRVHATTLGRSGDRSSAHRTGGAEPLVQRPEIQRVRSDSHG